MPISTPVKPTSKSSSITLMKTPAKTPSKIRNIEDPVSPFTGTRESRSKCWTYFKKESDFKSICSLCDITINTSGNTSNCWNHLENKHYTQYIALKGKKKNYFSFSYINQIIIYHSSNKRYNKPANTGIS